jgi:methyl-accepting chemotaxis protein
VNKVSSKLRIGEKTGLGFILVGLLFLGVVWHYHQTLKSVLADYQHLQSVFEVRKSLALDIEIDMAEARDAQKDFLIHRQERFASDVDHHLQGMREKVAALAAVDPQSRQTAEQIEQLVTTYHETFRAVATAWRSMGLDEDSGLQGAFREKIHRLHELSAQFSVDNLQTLLLQIRRNEKDLALRQEPAYREQVRKLITEFRQLLLASGLQETVRQKLLTDLAIYARSFEPYAETALKAGNVAGGKGPFRDAAHRMEATLNAHHVVNLETDILKLRRWEKDFLLRDKPIYPPKVLEVARVIRSQIAASALADADKAQLVDLLRDYQEGFLKLVEQRARIAVLTREMDAAADQITPLIQANVGQAMQLMAARADEISESSQARVGLGLLVLIGAIVLAIIFAVETITRIVRSIRQTAGLLDDLAYGRPTAHVAAVPGGRDEINCMAQSLNALLDHRANFLDWWKAATNELTAWHELDSAKTDAARDTAISELRAANVATLEQLTALRGRLLQHAECIGNIHQRLHAGAGRVSAEDVQSLEHAARGIVTLLDAVAIAPKTDAAAARPDL